MPGFICGKKPLPLSLAGLHGGPPVKPSEMKRDPKTQVVNRSAACGRIAGPRFFNIVQPAVRRVAANRDHQPSRCRGNPPFTTGLDTTAVGKAICLRLTALNTIKTSPRSALVR